LTKRKSSVVAEKPRVALYMHKKPQKVSQLSLYRCTHCLSRIRVKLFLYFSFELEWLWTDNFYTPPAFYSTPQPVTISSQFCCEVWWETTKMAGILGGNKRMNRQIDVGLTCNASRDSEDQNRPRFE